jgi:hypothetical protein
MSQVRRQDSLRRVRSWHRTPENGMQVRVRGPIGSVHPFLYSDAYGEAGEVMDEFYLLVLREGGSVEYTRPWVVEIKDYGILATLHGDDDSTKVLTKLVHPWENIVVFSQSTYRRV